MERYIPLMILGAFLIGCFIFLYLFLKAENMSDERVKLIDKILTNISIILFIPVTILAVFLVVTDHVSPFGGTIDANFELFLFWFGVSSPAWIIFCMICSISQKRKGADAVANAKLSVMLLTAGLISIGPLVYAATSMGGAPADYPQEDYFQAEYANEEYVQTEYIQEDYPQEDYAHAYYPQEEDAPEDYAPTEHIQYYEPGIPNIDNAEIEIGSIAEFGGIYWRILDIQDDRVLLLSDYILDFREFHAERTQTSWQASDLRGYLNEEFLYNRFTAEERVRIAETTLINYCCHSCRGRIDDTIDKIFLLSFDELLRYIGDSGEKPCEDDLIDDEYNVARLALVGENLPYAGHRSGWWLRSFGNSPAHAMGVAFDGRIAMWGAAVDIENVGVRPAMWVYLELQAE